MWVSPFKRTCILHKQVKFAITPQSRKKYCYFGGFESVLPRIMNGDP